MHEVVLPLLRHVGDAWHDGRLHVAHEHMLSAVMRSLLGTLLRLLPVRSHTFRLLLATPAGERHEFGILAAALLAAGRGIDITYLGADLPAAEVLHVVKRIRPDAVLLGMTRTSDNADSIADAARLAGQLPAGVTLWIGGPQAARTAAGFPGSRAMPIETIEALEAEFLRFENRA